MRRMGERPLVTLDLDGVLSRPPFGINPGRGKGKARRTAGKRSLLWLTERWRYAGRRPMPGAREGLRLLSERYDCVVLTARSEVARTPTRAWLARNFGIEPPVCMRPSWRETPAAFKVRMVQELGARAHFEDDPHTAACIAEQGIPVFLVDWRRNRWLEAPGVHRIKRIADALPLLETLARAGAGRQEPPGSEAASKG
jgi:hypothetical protein